MAQNRSEYEQALVSVVQTDKPLITYCSLVTIKKAVPMCDIDTAFLFVKNKLFGCNPDTPKKGDNLFQLLILFCIHS